MMGRFSFSDVATMGAAISRILFTQEYLHVVALVTEYIIIMYSIIRVSRKKSTTFRTNDSVYLTDWIFPN